VEAQAAHEAIRPTHPEAAELALEDTNQRTVYRLIWRRAVQSQMAPATTDVRKAVLSFAAEPDRVWNTEQTKARFAGWRALERADLAKAAAEVAEWETWKPLLVADVALNWTDLKADEHFTKPRGRFTEASLIAELEKRGIGRPSTFASLVGTIVDERGYVEKTNVEGTTQDSHHLAIKPNQWPPTETTQSHKVGAEKNKLRSTPLGRSVAAYLTREYSDLFNYEFTAAMEGDLDSIAKGAKPWKSLLQSTWDTYKERFAAHTAGGSAASKAARERVLADGVKIALTRKGPLFVKEPLTEGGKATFAAVPASVSFESATAADAEAAFTTSVAGRMGEPVGTLGDDTIYKKKGPYGFYAECRGARVPFKAGESIEVIQERLTAKLGSATGTEATYERKVGEFTIKRGPYGLYFFKPALKRTVFVKFPPTADAATATATDLAKFYTAGIAAKRGGGGGKKPAAPGGLKPAGGAGATD
jgi:DNA topoisomerase-1